MSRATSPRKLGLGLLIAACAIAAPTAQGYPIDPSTGDRLEVPTISRTAPGIHKPTKASKGKQRPRPRAKPALAPRQRSAR